jgi:hypothetical protein
MADPLTDILTTKDWYKSRTLWGGVLLYISSRLQVKYGIAGFTQDSVNQVLDFVAQAMREVGLILVFVGRIFAKKNLV